MNNEHFDFQRDTFGNVRKYFTRRQWSLMGRTVTVQDHEATKILKTMSIGRPLHLFSIEQTCSSEESAVVEPWKLEHRFTEDGKRKRHSAATYHTRGQWRAKQRVVTATDDEAVRAIETQDGHTLCLFAESQTRECVGR